MILKTVFDDGYEAYQDIGDDFHILRKGFSPEKFEETAKERLGEPVDDDTIAFVAYGQDKRVLPIYKDFKNCILSNDGKLFYTF